MTTLTMRQMEELPVGQTVTLRHNTGEPQQWVRREGGLEREGVTLALQHFRAAIDEGLFVTGERTLRSGWWTYGRTVYYVLDGPFNNGTDDEWFVIQMSSDFEYQNSYWTTSLPEGATRPDTFSTTDYQPQARWVRHLGAVLHRAEVTRRNAERAHDDQLTRLGEAFVQFADTYLDDNREGLFGVLSTHNIPFERPARTVSLRLTVEGTTRATRPDYDDVDFPSEFTEEDRDGAIRILWTYDIETDVQYEGTEGDACEDRDVFTNQWANEWLAERISGDWDGDSIEITSRGCSDC